MSSQPPRPRQLTIFSSFLAGALAACSAAVFSNPFEVIKTRLQLDGEGAKRGTPRQYAGIRDALGKIWRLEGLRGLQSGLAPALAYQVAMNGARLGLYDPAQRFYMRTTGAAPDSVVLKMAAGATSGAVGATLGSPLYLVKSRLQAQSAHFSVREAHHYSGALDGLRQVFAAEGVRGLFRGLNGALPRVMVGSATQLASFDGCRGLVAAAGVPAGLPQALSASLVASLFTVTLMNPLDVISSRLYQSAGKATRYSGPLDCALQTVRAEGLMALQKGWLAQYARLGPHTVMTLTLFSHLQPLFAQVDAFVVAAETAGE